MADSCEICDSEKNVHRHHLDGDRANDAEDNIVLLCQDHHSRVHNGEDGLDKYVDQLPDRAVKGRGGSMAQITLRLDKKTLAEVESVAEDAGVSRSRILRRLIHRGMNDDVPVTGSEKIERLEGELEYFKGLVESLVEKV